jgi:lysophospholipase L1-like esterase
LRFDFQYSDFMIASSRTGRSGARRIVLRLVLVLAGLLLGLGIAEGLIRRLAPHPRHPSLVVPDENTGFRLRPGARGRATNRYGEYDTEMRINAEGFRDRDHPLAKRADTCRIAFLGDSFTCGEQVEERQTFVRRVEEILNARGGDCGPSPAVECLNFGIGGYDTQQEVLCYEAYVRKYHPDIVVLAMYPHNDLTGNLFYKYERDFGRPYFRMENGALQKITADPARLEENRRKSERIERVRWYHHLHLYNAQKAFFHDWRQARQRRKDLAAIPPSDGPSSEKLWSVVGYRKYRYYTSELHPEYVGEVDAISWLLLRRLQEDVTRDKARLCVLLLPSEENLWPDRWSERVKLFPGMEGISMDFLRPYQSIPIFLPEAAAGGDILDLRPALRQAEKEGPIFFKRDFHYTERGHRAVAEAMAPWLASRLEVHAPGSD